MSQASSIASSKASRHDLVKLQDLPTHIRETLALQTILLQIGHDQDDLYVVFAKDALGISIFKNGEHHIFPSALRPADKKQNELVAEWSLACATWNESSQAEPCELTENSDVRKKAVLIIAELVDIDLMPVGKMEFSCPFCGRHVVADGANLSVLHVLPMCAKYQEMDPLKFLKECRYAMAGN